MNDDPLLWRYVDFAKFADFVQRGELYFPRADRLCRADPYEGSYIHASQFLQPETIFGETTLSKIYKEDLLGKPVNDFFQTPEELEKQKQSVFINCWHANEIESDAMWKLYSQSKYSVALLTRLSKLREEIKTNSTFWVDFVRYCQDDLEAKLKDLEHVGPFLRPFFIKRAEFEHEREVRAVIGEPAAHPKESNHLGRRVTVSFEGLVEKVYVAPAAPRWLGPVVQNLLKTYGFSGIQVHQSALMDDPPY